MTEKKLTYFVSDVHLGAGCGRTPELESRFVSFLNSIPAEPTAALYLLGDIWDFWYEYKSVVPKGYVKVFAALNALMENGVDVFFIPGNHDMWCYGYFEEMGVKILPQPHLAQLNGKTFCLGHGDSLGPVPAKDKMLGRLFRNRIARSLFSLLHPDAAFALARKWSEGSRHHHPSYKFGDRNEPLVDWATRYCEGKNIDYFIFGHYHCPAETTLPSGAKLLVSDCWRETGTPHLLWDGESLTRHK